MPSDALAAPQMPPIREIRPRGGTQKSVEGRWTHHVRCFFVPLAHRPDVCGWFGRWGRLGLRHLGGWLVSGRRAQVVLNLIEVVVLSTKHSLPCLACTRREANYPKAQYSGGVPRNFPKGGLPGDLPRAHPDIAQRPSNAGAHPQTRQRVG